MAECQWCGSNFPNGTISHAVHANDCDGSCENCPVECGPVRDEIFVFGSNLAGRHGRGSAYEAKKNWGARYGVGAGPAGHSYAIPTKDERLRVLSLGTIRRYIDDFLEYARNHSELIFRVVKIGCGLAGYKEADIKPLFRDAPTNCRLPKGWRE